MYRYILLIVSVMACFSSRAHDFNKFDLQSIAAIEFYKTTKASPGRRHAVPLEMPFEIKTNSRGVSADAGAIVTLNPCYSFEALSGSGLTVEARLGDDMCVVVGPVEDIIALEGNVGVKSVSFGSKYDAHLDVSRHAMGVDMIHQGVDLPGAFTGKGVVCGIFDTGVDPNHLNFYDSEAKTSRVKAVYHTPYANGTVIDYVTPDEIVGFTTDSKTSSHGTHTLGCMAGGFRLPGNLTEVGKPTGEFAYLPDSHSQEVKISADEPHPFYGMAPESDILVACGPLYNSNILAGVGRIVDYAKAVGRPAVVNLSIGQNIGPHDGSDSFCRGLERLGRDAIICMAAGNDGYSPRSIVKTFSEGDTSVRTALAYYGNVSGIIDAWSSTADSLDVRVVLVNSSTGAIVYELPLARNDSKSLATKNYEGGSYIHEEIFDSIFSNSYILANTSDNVGTNNRFEASIQYYLNYSTASDIDKQILLGLVINGKPGVRADIVTKSFSGNAYLSGFGLNGWTSGTPELSISSLACGENVIAVGAWCNRPEWGRLNHGIGNNGYTEGHVARFSSYGTTVTGKSLPHVLASGATVISSMNSYQTENYDDSYNSSRYHFKNRRYLWGGMEGTSMSSPIVAGIIACWLEYNPDLTVDEARDILCKTADFDEYCAMENPVKAGAGKVQAYAGLKEVVRRSGVSDVDVDSDTWLQPIGENVYEAFSPGNSIKAEVYNLAGRQVATFSDSSDTTVIDLNQYTKGVYILRINNTKSFRILVK